MPNSVFHIGVNRGRHSKNVGPFSAARALCAYGDTICAADLCADDASAEVMEAKHAEMQRELEHVRDIAESGSPSAMPSARSIAPIQPLKPSSMSGLFLLKTVN